jgi:hypothetical protein
MLNFFRKPAPPMCVDDIVSEFSKTIAALDTHAVSMHEEATAIDSDIEALKAEIAEAEEAKKEVILESVRARSISQRIASLLATPSIEELSARAQFDDGSGLNFEKATVEPSGD